jgi:C4-dicarboxylate transporter, DctM subunit
MSPIEIGIIGFIVFFVLLAAGLSVGISMAVVGFVGYWALRSFGPAMVVLKYAPFTSASNYDFSCIPLFLLAAYVVFQAGFGRDMFDIAAKWLGRLPGGLAIATVGGCAGFAAIDGSSVATTVSMSAVALPEMKRYGYASSLAVGSIAAGGTIGILIPPSNLLIIYGVITQTSIISLFLAGAIPGILEAVFYWITILVICTRNPNLGPKGASYSFREKVTSLRAIWPLVVLIGIVMGGLIAGWYTPVEAGSMSAAIAILLSVLLRRLNWQKFKQALIDTLKITGMLYVLVTGAYIFMPFITLSTLPTQLSTFVTNLNVPPIVVMMLIILVYIILGCFMESLSMVLITIPIFFPVCVHLGYDPIWFGIIVVRVVEIGMVTPPFGINAYTMSTISGVPIDQVFKGLIPFIIADILNVALLLLVPQIPLFLPSLF